METTTKRLYKSRTNRVIDGVCGGVAAYLGVDPVLVRIAWVLLAIAGGIGVVLYIAGMILMPAEPFSFSGRPVQEAPSRRDSVRLVAGAVLVLAGLAFLADNLDLLTLRSVTWFFSSFFFPILLIGAGITLVLVKKNGSAAGTSSAGESPAEGTPSEQTFVGATGPTAGRRLLRSRVDRKIFGVCGGLSSYFDIDSTIIRLLLIGSAFLSFGLTILAYLLLSVVLSEEPLFPGVQGDPSLADSPR